MNPTDHLLLLYYCYLLHQLNVKGFDFSFWRAEEKVTYRLLTTSAKATVRLQLDLSINFHTLCHTHSPYSHCLMKS